ncbi:MAG: riboflavin synthase [Lachnospiraceae bacterium]|nr:riboflavin synthase [Lachnospiraceae bacterium]
MFTGIVEETGVIKRLNIAGKSGSVEIKAAVVLEGTKVGDSIAVNGICLTVTSLTADYFTADVMAETVRRSSLKSASAGDKVNLERAMAADGRFGGHIVSGHIDGTGTIADMRREENAVWIRIKAAPEILALIVEKGSICIEGISLTVAAVTDEDFSVSVIPHTLDVTVLSDRKRGDIVNLENDIVGKYVQKLMGLSAQQPEKSGSVTREMLELLR